MKPISHALAGLVLLRFSGGSSSFKLQHREFTLNTPLLPLVCFPTLLLVVTSQRGAARFGSGTHVREQGEPAHELILEKIRNGSRLSEVNLWMWRYGRGQERNVSVRKCMEARAKRMHEARGRAAQTCKRRRLAAEEASMEGGAGAASP